MKTIRHLTCYLLCGAMFSLSFVCQANWGRRHYHDHNPYFDGPRNYYDRGWYPRWGGPNVIINIPVPAPIYVPPPGYIPPQYIPQCEVIEVCNSDECWLEQECR